MHPLGRYERNIEGEPEYKKIPPEPIYVFRDASPTDAIVLPEKYKNRKCTDVAFIIILVVFIACMTGFTIYLLIREPPQQRYKSYSYDRGEDSWNNNYHHSYRDYRRKGKSYGITRDDNKENNFEINVKNWCLTIIFMPVIGILCCLLVYMGLRWCTKGCFWCLMGTNIVLLAVSTIAVWIVAVTFQAGIMLYVYAVFCTFMFVVFLLVLWCYRKKFKLIIMTYKEALTAIFKVPMVLFTPLLTILWMIIVFAPVAAWAVIMIKNPVYETLTYVYGLFMMFKFFWSTLFIQGSQIFVVAGSIAAYYFARDKSNLGSPYCNSLRIYIRFHTGTVAAGSLIIAILRCLRTLMEQQQEEAEARGNLALACLACICASCLQCLEEIAEYLTTKAYIMSSIHGKPLCASGKRACRLLWSNLLDTVAVDQIGGCALVGAAFLILIAASGAGILIVYNDLVKSSIGMNFYLNGMMPFCIGLFLVAFIVGFYLDVISVAVQTIFLCFCEDKEINDGSRNRPYFMSQGLLNVLQTAYNDKYGYQNVQ